MKIPKNQLDTGHQTGKQQDVLLYSMCVPTKSWLQFRKDLLSPSGTLENIWNWTVVALSDPSQPQHCILQFDSVDFWRKDYT